MNDAEKIKLKKVYLAGLGSQTKEIVFNKFSVLTMAEFKEAVYTYKATLLKLPLVGQKVLAKIVENVDNADGRLVSCRLCDEPTPVVFNIKFKPVPICDRCADLVALQQVQGVLQDPERKRL